MTTDHAETEQSFTVRYREAGKKVSLHYTRDKAGNFKFLPSEYFNQPIRALHFQTSKTGTK